MAAVDYASLRLTFTRRGEREYDLVASTDDGRRAAGTFTLPMSEDELRDAVTTLAATRSAAAAVESGSSAAAGEPSGGADPAGDATRKVVPEAAPEAQVTAQQLGSLLADAIFTGDVDALFREVRARGDLRIRLEMTEEPELLAIPWEFLCRKSLFLASQPGTTVVRELATDEPEAPAEVTGRLRILGVIASPSDLHPLDTDSEKRRVEHAIASHGDRVEVVWLDDCTWDKLQQALREPFHILHYVGHSAFTDDGEAVLFLEDETGASKQVSATALANLVGVQKTLQLVVLNSCEGARTTLEDPFAGLATKLVQQGRSAVVAMQFEITDKAAVKFADVFYDSLIGLRNPVDVAMAEARMAVMGVNEIEFATPVLFLRDGRADLFRFVSPSDASTASGDGGVSGDGPRAADGQTSPRYGEGAEASTLGLNVPVEVVATTTAPPVRPLAPWWRRPTVILAIAGAGLGAAALVIALSVRNAGSPSAAITNTTVAATVAEGTAPPTTFPVELFDAVDPCIGGPLFTQDGLGQFVLHRLLSDAAADTQAAQDTFDELVADCDFALTELRRFGHDTSDVYFLIDDRRAWAEELTAADALDEDVAAFDEARQDSVDELEAAWRELRGLPPG